MPELREILPRPARVAKRGRCAEGPSVKTMLYESDHVSDLWFPWPRMVFGVLLGVGERVKSRKCVIEQILNRSVGAN